MSYVTPWTGELTQGTYNVTVPANIDNYTFQKWENGDSNPLRSINLTSNMNIQARYLIEEEPPTPPTITPYIIPIAMIAAVGVGLYLTFKK